MTVSILIAKEGSINSLLTVATISLECSSAEVSESMGEVDVCAILVEGELAINVSVNVSTVCIEACGEY